LDFGLVTAVDVLSGDEVQSRVGARGTTDADLSVVVDVGDLDGFGWPDLFALHQPASAWNGFTSDLAVEHEALSGLDAEVVEVGTVNVGREVAGLGDDHRGRVAGFTRPSLVHSAYAEFIGLPLNLQYHK